MEAGKKTLWLATPVSVLVIGTGAALAQQTGAAGEAMPSPPWLDSAMHTIATAIEMAGIAVIVIGALAASYIFLRDSLRSKSWDAPYHCYRSSLGRAILLGLEFLVAADIIGTVAIEPSLQSLAVLAGIVLIRTFLSFALEVEIEGRWPWRRGRDRERDGQPAPSASQG